MTKNEEISDLINPLISSPDYDFIYGLGNEVVKFFKTNTNYRDYSNKLQFYFIQREIFRDNIPFTFIDVTPINDELQEIHIDWLKESSVHFLGKHTTLTSQIQEYVKDDDEQLLLQNILLQQMNFSVKHFEPKLPTLKIKSAINETLENNYWL